MPSAKIRKPSRRSSASCWLSVKRQFDWVRKLNFGVRGRPGARSGASAIGCAINMTPLSCRSYGKPCVTTFRPSRPRYSARWRGFRQAQWVQHPIDVGSSSAESCRMPRSPKCRLHGQLKIFRSDRPFGPKAYPPPPLMAGSARCFRGDISNDREAIRSDLPDEKRSLGGHFR